MKYIKQLDSLRAIAIITVVITHWFPKTSVIYTISARFTAPSIFFTLSGFLITFILLKEKDIMSPMVGGRFKVYKNFFLKRALRLFPAYYLLLIFTMVFKPTDKPIEYLYFFTFTSNYYLSAIREWPALSHLWSMAVEEQF